MSTAAQPQETKDTRGQWQEIGTVVGNANTSEFTFILKSFCSRVGDLVTVRMDVPNDDYKGQTPIYVWGRVTGIERYNPFFPVEAAQELSNEGISITDTILSDRRDQLEARVLILGCTHESTDPAAYSNLMPLTYPVKPAARVFNPPTDVVRALLVGGMDDQTPLHVGSLIARSDVDVELSADSLVARHMAIFAMTGGGKTVAARRIIKGLSQVGYPLVILDPHGDYLGLWENRKALGENVDVRLFFPQLVMTDHNDGIVQTLIAKMTDGLTEPQVDCLSDLLNIVTPKAGQAVREYIERLTKEIFKEDHRLDRHKQPTKGAVMRSLRMVLAQLVQMEESNARMRKRFRDITFEALPDPSASPERIVRPNQISILYLGGYDHLTQCTIASILLEALFSHRAHLTERIPPFMTVVEEAHTFIPSSREGTSEAVSIGTIRKMITEGRKFGTGLLLISQRPSRLDETIVSQCNSFLILRLVNPNDQRFVKTVMENLSESDARMLPGFGKGQGIISGQVVRFPLLVKIRRDEDLLSSKFGGDENFLEQARGWKPDAKAALRDKVRKPMDELKKKRRGRR